MCIERRSFLEENDVSQRSAGEHRDDIWEHSGSGNKGGFREYTYIGLSELGQTHQSLSSLFPPLTAWLPYLLNPCFLSISLVAFFVR